MRQTVSFPASTKPVTDDSLLSYVNEEALKLLPQLRTFANMLSWELKTLTTTGTGLFTSIWTSPAMPSNATWLVTAWVTGIYTAGNPDRAAFLELGSYVSLGGTVSALASLELFATKSNAAIGVQFVSNGDRTISLQVKDRGDTVSTMKFVAVVATCEASTS